MFAKLKMVRLVGVSAALVVLGALFFAPGASAANHKGEYAVFNQCPSTNPEVRGCVYEKITSGEVVLGKKRVPIVNPVIFQGGFGEITTPPYNKFFPAANGETVTKAPQPVPGGLAGIVNCKEITNPLFIFLRISCEATFENGLTGVNATVELARPATEIKFSLINLVFGSGTGIQLPVRIHLENPFLGSACYIGSSSTPIIWNLTTGKTAPPPPNTSISGSTGKFESKGDDGEIQQQNGIKLVDNAWAAPGATGCGGAAGEFLINPIVNASVGVPSPAGKNTTILIGVADVAPSEAVNKH